MACVRFIVLRNACVFAEFVRDAEMCPALINLRTILAAPQFLKGNFWMYKRERGDGCYYYYYMPLNVYTCVHIYL